MQVNLQLESEYWWDGNNGAGEYLKMTAMVSDQGTITITRPTRTVGIYTHDTLTKDQISQIINMYYKMNSLGVPNMIESIENLHLALSKSNIEIKLYSEPRRWTRKVVLLSRLVLEWKDIFRIYHVLSKMMEGPSPESGIRCDCGNPKCQACFPNPVAHPNILYQDPVGR